MWLMNRCLANAWLRHDVIMISFCFFFWPYWFCLFLSFHTCKCRPYVVWLSAFMCIHIKLQISGGDMSHDALLLCVLLHCTYVFSFECTY